MSLLFGHLHASSRYPVLYHAFRCTALRLLQSKVAVSAADALKNIRLNDKTVAIGGFGVCGTPETLINYLIKEESIKDLKLASMDAGPDGFFVSQIVAAGKVKKLTTSYVGESSITRQAFVNGKLELEIVPQGTLAARFTAAGNGTPAFFSRTGVNTLYSDGGIPIKYEPDGSQEVQLVSQPRRKETFDGQDYMLEHALHADVSLVKAWKADTAGNLIFHGTSMNSNPDVAKAGHFCVAEAEEIVQAGELDPSDIHLPGVYVHRVIHADDNVKPIYKLRIQSELNSEKALPPGRERILRRLAKEFKDGMYVNLGIGLPTGASNFIPEGIEVEMHAEIGLLGAGPYPQSLSEVDPDFVNAGKETITPIKGAATFSSSESFEIVRGGHLDLTVLGGLQVSSAGDLANWFVPGKILLGMGGAMDLVGAPHSKVIVTMEHLTKDGCPKIVDECTYPLTGKGVVDMVITDKAVFDVDKRGGTGLTLTEVAPGLTVDDIRKITFCDFKVADPLGIMDEVNGPSNDSQNHHSSTTEAEKFSSRPDEITMAG